MVNNSTGYRWWSPTFCGVCDHEKRDANQALLKGTYFLSTKSLGSHNIVLGGEMYDDQRFSNNHQSGSDYRIYTTRRHRPERRRLPGRSTRRQTGNSPSFIRWTPILEGTQGNSFKTYSVYLNDTWRLNRSFTFNLGVRYDKNDGQDGTGRKTVDDGAFSPRLGMTWDVKADGDMVVNASYAKYVAGINNSQGDSASLGGQPATVDFDYRGPTYQHRPERHDAHLHRGRHPRRLRLVRSQRRHRPPDPRHSDHPRHQPEHRRHPRLPEHRRVRRRPHQAPRHEGLPPRRRRLPQVERLLRDPRRHGDRDGLRLPRRRDPDLRQADRREHRRGGAASTGASR